MTEPRIVDAVKAGGKFCVAPVVLDDPVLWKTIFPGLKAEVLDEMSKLGTVVESTLEWNIELPNPMECGPDDQGWRSYPYVVFTAYVIPDGADA